MNLGESSQYQPNITYSEKEAVYDVDCIVTSAADDITEPVSTSVEIAHYKYVTKDADSVRVAQFNSGLSDQAGRVEGELQKRLKDPSWVAAKNSLIMIMFGSTVILGTVTRPSKWCKISRIISWQSLKQMRQKPCEKQHELLSENE